MENLSLNGNHLTGIDLVLRSEFDHAMHGGLRVDHRVVFLNGALDDALVPLLVPVNVDLHSQEMVDAQWALDHLQGTLHTSSCEEQRVHRAERRLCRGESFPLRKRLRANDSEGRIADRSHSDGVRDLLLAQAE